MSAWTLRYDGFDPADEGLREALCTLGNGYLATRGAAPEAIADGVHYPGTYVAGCYDRQVTELAGTRVTNEDLVNLPNWLPSTFRIDDGAWFVIEDCEVLAYRLELDLRRGVLTRLVRVRDGADRTTRVTQRRLVSMDDPHVAALETTILAEDWSGRLEIMSAVDGRVENAGVARYRDLEGRHLAEPVTSVDGDVVTLFTKTLTSHVEVGVAARTRLRAAGDAERAAVTGTGVVAHHLTTEVAEGEEAVVEKVAAVFTSRDHAVADVALAAHDRVADADGFDQLLRRHAMAWHHLWRRARLDVDGPDVQRTLNLYFFHLLQTISPHTADLDVGVPARGLHGEAYRGHVFWDELFVFPFLNLRLPEVARALLLYRWRRLPAARRAAHATRHRGAMFPWQSATDGREETQELHLNPVSGRWLPDHSRLQRHVGLAIAYNVWQHYETTGDVDFLADYSAELLLEIARYFAGLATYNHTLDRYEIRGVMGPDEYHDALPHAADPGLRNNAYTNVMTVWVLRRALDVLAAIPAYRRHELREKLDLDRAEIQRFDDVSRKMRVVFHDGVISQFEGYADLAELDWDAYRATYGDIRRLDRILEAEGDTPNSYKVSKQADVLMLFYLLSADELAEILTRLGYAYDPQLIPRTVSYYLARTSHGSTLSAVVHAWVLARSDRTASWRFFVEALHSDVADVQGGTTAEGIHLGAMAGVLDLAQRCYSGLESRDGMLQVDPRLPDELGTLTFDVRYRGCWGLTIRCGKDGVEVGSEPGAPSVEVVASGGRTHIVPTGPTRP